MSRRVIVPPFDAVPPEPVPPPPDDDLPPQAARVIANATTAVKVDVLFKNVPILHSLLDRSPLGRGDFIVTATHRTNSSDVYLDDFGSSASRRPSPSRLKATTI